MTDLVACNVTCYWICHDNRFEMTLWGWQYVQIESLSNCTVLYWQSNVPTMTIVTIAACSVHCAIAERHYSLPPKHILRTFGSFLEVKLRKSTTETWFTWWSKHRNGRSSELCTCAAVTGSINFLVWQDVFRDPAFGAHNSLTVPSPWFTACINLCAHSKNLKCWQTYHCLDTQKYCTHWQEWVVLLLRLLLAVPE